MDLADLYGSTGRFAEAGRLLDQARDDALATLGPDHAVTLAVINAAGSNSFRQGRYDEALSRFRTAYERRARLLGPDHADTLFTMNNLVLAYAYSGRNAEAADLAGDLVDRKRRVLGADNPSTLASMVNLAQLSGRRRSDRRCGRRSTAPRSRGCDACSARIIRGRFRR